MRQESRCKKCLRAGTQYLGSFQTRGHLDKDLKPSAIGRDIKIKSRNICQALPMQKSMNKCHRDQKKEKCNVAFFSLKRVTITKSVGEKINTYITFMGCYCVLSTILSAVDNALINPTRWVQ